MFKEMYNITDVCFLWRDLTWDITVYIYIVECRAVAMQWSWDGSDIPGPFVGIGSVNMFPLLSSRFLIMQQLDYKSGNGVFLPDLYWDVISKGQG
jgi:hypothetical protein